MGKSLVLASFCAVLAVSALGGNKIIDTKTELSSFEVTYSPTSALLVP